MAIPLTSVQSQPLTDNITADPLFLQSRLVLPLQTPGEQE